MSVDVGSDGKVNFDAIVKQGTNRNKTVLTKLSDMKVRGEEGCRHAGGLGLMQVVTLMAACLLLDGRLLAGLQEREADQDALAKPSEEEESEAAAKTRKALEAIIGSKVAAARPTHIPQTQVGQRRRPLLPLLPSCNLSRS